MARAAIDAGEAFAEVDRLEEAKAARASKAGASTPEHLDERAAAVADPTDGARTASVEGARGQAALRGARRSWPVGARTFFVVIGMVVLGIVAVLLGKAHHVRKDSETRRDAAGSVARVERHVPPLELSMVPGERGFRSRATGGSELTAQNGREHVAPVGANGSHPAAPVVAEKPDGAPQLSEAQKLEQRRLGRGFGGEAGADSAAGGEQGAQLSGGAASMAPPAPPVPGRDRAGTLEEKLEPMQLKGASAGLLEDRDYLLTQGTMLDCVLETRLVSTVPGMTSCHLTRNIYSANGHVVLLDRGSKVVGHYQAGAQQGEARIFVVWTRVETPNGVVVELDSPGTGALGEAGMDGWVDTHFWDRFGAAILLSLIQDGTDALGSRAAGPGQSAITFSNQASAGKQVVERSMEPTLNIPPTIVKNQGERLGIFVARDLDFRSVYELARVDVKREDRRLQEP